jgi:glycosyl hydrolase family 9/cellulase-like Ig domain-containing protein
MLRRGGLIAAAAAVTVFGLPVAAGRAAPAPHAQLRVDQAGYVTSEAKQAIVMTSQPAGGAAFELRRHGRVVLAGRVARTDRGAWNATYAHTYAVRFGSVHRAGSYLLVVHTTPAVRAHVRIRSIGSLYRQVLGYGVRFDQVQRDGARVVAGPLHRRPAHRHDARAAVYAWPNFDPDTDEITDPGLTRIGGPVDAAGGWFDAGDYVKFTHTAAFADVVLQSAQRELGSSAPPALGREARYGLTWLMKMWHPSTRTLYLQVGTGNGTANGKYYGDHDLWRLPEADDHNAAPVDRFAAAHRPVFAAAAAGRPISPNLAGRVAAAFALAAQNDATPAPRRAAAEFAQAKAILRLADTASPPDPLTTSLPNDFYPESTWHDDMELGSAETALAAQRLHRPSTHWVMRAAHWARGYFRTERGDTFNLYDVSALAHTDLVRAMDGASRVPGLAVSRHALLADLARQLSGAAGHARSDPFHAAGNVAEFDVDSHTFGLIATAGWYHQLTGSSRYDRLATQQRNWLFGTNAWGVSFMVGIGSTYPHCMQHQIANLSGSTTGRAPIALGAVVNGPNSADLFSDGLDGFQDGMRHCALTRYAAFDGHGSRYLDDVRSWQTDEPAIDMTGAAIAAAAAQLAR